MLIKSRSRILVVALLCWAGNSFAQIELSARYEILDRDGTFRVIPAREEGVLLCRSVPVQKGENQLELIQLDTALHERWHTSIPIEPQLKFLFSEFRNGVHYLLFRDQSGSTGNFTILTLQIGNGSHHYFVVKNLIPFIPEQFVLTNDAALIGGYFNYRPLVVFYNFYQNQSKVLPGFFNEPGELTQIRNNDDGSIDVAVTAKNFERKKCLWLRNYDHTGTLIKTVIITPEENKTLIFGSSMPAIQNEQLVTGVFGKRAEFSRGIFVANVNPVGEYATRYYNYSDLPHFFNYMKASRQKRIKEKIERKKIKGRKVKFNYRVLVHELIPYKNQYIMIGEAFYPHYSYSTHGFGNLSYRNLSNPLARDNYMVFDGYQYTHAVVIGFDKAGNVLWDNSFEISGVRSMQLKKFVKVQPEEDRIVLHYLFADVLRTKIIKDNQVLEGITVDDGVKKGKEKSKPNPASTTVLENWYRNYFVAYGSRDIKNSRMNSRGLPVDDWQKVFFINKITYK